MNLILLQKEDFPDPDGAVARLSGRRLVHLREVLKAMPGKCCKAGLRNGPIGRAEVLEIGAAEARLAVTWEREPPPKLPLKMVLALPRPKTFRKVVHAAVTLGVEELCFINSFKVDKSYWRSPELGGEALRELVDLALEQAVDTVPPAITFEPLFKPWVEDRFPAWRAGRTVYLAHPGSAARLPRDPATPAVLILGPEGGFTDYEVRRLTEAGAQPVSLGARILRTETALPALAAAFIG